MLLSKPMLSANIIAITELTSLSLSRKTGEFDCNSLSHIRATFRTGHFKILHTMSTACVSFLILYQTTFRNETVGDGRWAIKSPKSQQIHNYCNLKKELCKPWRRQKAEDGIYDVINNLHIAEWPLVTSLGWHIGFNFMAQTTYCSWRK